MIRDAAPHGLDVVARQQLAEIVVDVAALEFLRTAAA
jgi:hypothetical protein